MLRILEQIEKKEKVKRTPLAMYCGMSYDRLVNYLIFLVDVELVTITEEDKEKFVRITNQGNKARIALSSKINKI